MSKIAVYLETNLNNYTLNDVSYELLTKARQLKTSAKEIDCKDNDFEVIGIALSKNIDKDSVKKAFCAGADYFVHIKDSSLEIFSQTVFSLSFVEYFSSNPCEIILFPATPQGRIVAPRITTMLDVGLVADCTGLDLIKKNDNIMLAATRPTFGSELMATILSKKNPQCATVRPKTFQVDFTSDLGDISDRFSEYELKYPINETRIKLLRSFFEKEVEGVDFDNAKIILAGGYGLYMGKNVEYFEKLENLAKKINAKFAATRKVVDLNLVPKAYQVGQTGSTVNPDLYVAFGISGAIQHMVGSKNAKKIIAINSDENADIFKYADYKIVADAKKVIDELLNYF